MLVNTRLPGRMFQRRMTAMRTLALGVVLIVASLGNSQQPVDEKAFTDKVSEADLRRYVRELVAFGPRMGGTPSNQKSAAYLGEFFKKQGLDVAFQEDAPALAH